MSSYTMDPARWARQLSGEGCPFCLPRPADNEHWACVAKLSRSSLMLSRDQRFEGRCLLIWDGPHAVGLGALSEQDHGAFMADLRAASLALESACPCDLLNMASLGNQIAHLHFHLIPRRESDPRWGAPPWTTSPDELPERRLDEQAFQLLRESIARALLPNPHQP